LESLKAKLISHLKLSFFLLYFKYGTRPVAVSFCKAAGNTWNVVSC